MKIAYITAGAAGMFCGSCMRDNTLVAALARLGHEALLVPTYTPIRTDEKDVSSGPVFFGGINVYLQQKFWLFRKTPWLLDALLNFKPLLRWVSRFAARTQARELGELTVSMLQGEHGHQSKEVAKLVHWLARDLRPEVVNLTNALLCGFVRSLRKRWPGPVLCSLQGDDIFTESLPEPYKAQALALIRERGQDMTAFIATSASYADFMAGYFDVPRGKAHVVLPGLDLRGHGGRPSRDGQPFTVGYFARLCPEKGFHHLVDAFIRLKAMPGTEGARLHASGWLGESSKPWYSEQVAKLEAAGLKESYAHAECPDHASKVRFLHGLDVLSVPTVYHEPKGLYVLEALANGVPVAQPAHGSFPELVEATGGGVLVEPENPQALAKALHRLMEDKAGREEMGRRGQEAVHRRFTAARMAEETAALYGRYAR
ncbi:MAG: glycosyltransferase family 4 protein [Gemmataceae bacterium]|nr:glycosyltransferase family 4 protein [Gemmataceae bacterium]